jgi:hypothetical protein
MHDRTAATNPMIAPAKCKNSRFTMSSICPRAFLNNNANFIREADFLPETGQKAAGRDNP